MRSTELIGDMGLNREEAGSGGRTGRRDEGGLGGKKGTSNEGGFECGSVLGETTRPFEEHYSLSRFLGKGAFGEVWVCREEASSKDYACKVFEKARVRTGIEKSDMQREVALLRAFKGKHRGIVQLHEVLDSEECVHVVMEMCRGGDLFDLLKINGRLPESSARHVFQQVASALEYCHSRGVIHRDIKPENILFDEPAASLYSTPFLVSAGAPGVSIGHKLTVQAKLADFGLSTVVKPGQTTDGYTGSRYYTAPEMVRGKEYGRRTDVWSLGVVLCTMLTGRLPFCGKTKKDDGGLVRAILHGKVNFSSPAWDGVSPLAKDLVSRMLAVEPHDRLRALDVLVHPWLTGAISLTPEIKDVRSQATPSAPDFASRLREATPGAAQEGQRTAGGNAGSSRGAFGVQPGGGERRQTVAAPASKATGAQSEDSYRIQTRKRMGQASHGMGERSHSIFLGALGRQGKKLLAAFQKRMQPQNKRTDAVTQAPIGKSYTLDGTEYQGATKPIPTSRTLVEGTQAPHINGSQYVTVN